MTEQEKLDIKASKLEDQIDAAEEKKTRAAILREKDEARIQRELMRADAEKQMVHESVIESVRRTRKIIQGQIVGVEEYEIDEVVSRCAVVFTADGTKIVIPYGEMYTSNIMDMRSVNLESNNGFQDYLVRQGQILAKLNGLTVDLCIKQIIENYKESGIDLIVGSRKDALIRQQKTWFNPARPRITENEFYEATIISVAPKSLAATFHGVDFLIQLKTLTNRPVDSLQDFYKPGDKLPFYLSKITYNEAGEPVLHVNTIRAELEECRKRWRNISVGAIAKATITRVNRNRATDKSEFYAWIDGYNLACYIPYMDANDFGREVKLGDEVQVVVNRFRDNGYIEVRCKSLLGGATRFSL